MRSPMCSTRCHGYRHTGASAHRYLEILPACTSREAHGDEAIAAAPAPRAAPLVLGEVYQDPRPFHINAIHFPHGVFLRSGDRQRSQGHVLTPPMRGRGGFGAGRAGRCRDRSSADTHGIIAAVEFDEAELALDRDVANFPAPAQRTGFCGRGVSKHTGLADEQHELPREMAGKGRGRDPFGGGVVTVQTRTRGRIRARARRGSRRTGACPTCRRFLVFFFSFCFVVFFQRTNMTEKPSPGDGGAVTSEGS